MRSIGREILRFGGVPLRFTDQGIVSPGNFALGALVARALGAQSFGIFALVWMIENFSHGRQWAFIAFPMQSTFCAEVLDESPPSEPSASSCHRPWFSC
jgi:hypothetical protein